MIENVTAIVDGSMGDASIGCFIFGSAMVSETVVDDKPETAMISPALADSRGVLSSPSKARTLVIRDCYSTSPVLDSDFTVIFGFTSQEVIRPVKTRPR